MKMLMLLSILLCAVNVASPIAEWRDYAAKQTLSFFDPSTGRFGSPGDWQSANSLDAMATYCWKTGNKTILKLLEESFDTITNAPPVPQTTPDNWGAANDDVQWGAYGWLSLYRADHDIRYAKRASTYLEWVLDNEKDWMEHDVRCRAPGVADKTISGVHSCSYNFTGGGCGKNTITNTQYFQTAMRLHPFAEALNKDKDHFLLLAIDQWHWLEYAGFQAPGGLWNDDLDMNTCKNDGHDVTFSYNQGVVLTALALLADATQNKTLFEAGYRTIDAVMKYMAYKTPQGLVLHEPQGRENGTEHDDCSTFWGGPCRRWAIFKGIFMRNLAEFIVLMPDEEKDRKARYTQFVISSAWAAWNHGRCQGGGFSYDWSGTESDFNISCHLGNWTNPMAQNSAALDLFNAAGRVYPKTEIRDLIEPKYLNLYK